jgi:multidrug resistance protein, MATE family
MRGGELGIIARHAGTVLVGQLAVIAFSITDTIVAGRYADNAIAALSIGFAIYISAYVSLLGVLQSLLPVYAELHGARRYAELGRTFRQSIYLALLVVAIGMAVMLWPGALLRASQVPDALRPDIERYLAVLALALLPAMGFRMYSSLNQALGKPQLVTVLQIVSLLVKVPLTVWFAFGGAGLQPMGLVGCAWATFCVNWLMLLAAWAMLRTQDIYQPLQLWQRMEAPNAQQLLHFARMGVPGGLAYLVEITSFTLMSLFIARLGVVSAASHQIASNMAGTMYMMPLALGIACSARVSFWIGAGQAAKARRVATMGLGATMVLALLVASCMAFFSTRIAGLYSANPAVVSLAASLLLWVALYHFADATQSICAFLLRCYRVTLMPLVIYGVLLWGVGLYGGYLLAYQGIDTGFGSITAMQSAQAFWIAGAAAIGIVAILFIALLARSISAERQKTSHNTRK